MAESQLQEVGVDDAVYRFVDTVKQLPWVRIVALQRNNACRAHLALVSPSRIRALYGERWASGSYGRARDGAPGEPSTAGAATCS